MGYASRRRELPVSTAIDSRLTPKASPTKTRGRMPKKIARGGDGALQITIRVSDSVKDRATALMDFLSELRSIPAARADVYREALTIGLVALEERAAKAKKKQ